MYDDIAYGATHCTTCGVTFVGPVAQHEKQNPARHPPRKIDPAKLLDQLRLDVAALAAFVGDRKDRLAGPEKLTVGDERWIAAVADLVGKARREVDLGEGRRYA